MSAYTWVIPSPAPVVSGSGGSSSGSSTAIRGRALRSIDMMFDPYTRDFIDTDDGEWAETDDSRTAVMMQMESARDRWWGDPTAGSFLGVILAADIQTAAEVRDEALRALQALVDEAVITGLTVEIEQDEMGRAAFVLSYTDRQSGRPVDLALVPS